MFFVKYKEFILSTPYETLEKATSVQQEMLQLRQFAKGKLDGSCLIVVEQDIDTTKRGHKNEAKDDLKADAQRQLNNLLSLIYKSKIKKHEKTLEDSSDIDNMKAIHGSEWRKYLNDENGLNQKDEERYRYRFKVTKKPTIKEIVRFTGLNIYQVYLLQQKTKLYPEPRITKDEASRYLKYVTETGDTFSNGFNFSDDSYLEEYSVAN